MLALALFRSQLCPLHGGPLDECDGPATDRSFMVPPPRVCRAQDLLLLKQENHASDRPGAWLWTVQKRKRR